MYMYEQSNVTHFVGISIHILEKHKLPTFIADQLDKCWTLMSY